MQHRGLLKSTRGSLAYVPKEKKNCVEKTMRKRSAGEVGGDTRHKMFFEKLTESDKG